MTQTDYSTASTVGSGMPPPRGAAGSHRQDRISPTGAPPPSTSTRPVRRTASASTPGSSVTPSRSSAAAISTGRTRRRRRRSSAPRPGRRPAPPRSRTRPRPCRSHPGPRAAAAPRRAGCPTCTPGGSRMASATAALGTGGRRSPATPNARASPVSDADSSGAPQPSTATTSTGSPVSSANVSADRDLERVVGVEVGRGVPAVDHARRQHGRVLARAVHRRSTNGRPPARIRPPRGPARRSGSPAGSAAPTRQPGTGEDASYALEVERLAGVRRAGQGQQRRRRGRARRAACRPPAAACCTTAAGSCARRRRATTATEPSGAERHDRAVVVALDEPGADDLGDDDG